MKQRDVFSTAAVFVLLLLALLLWISPVIAANQIVYNRYNINAKERVNSDGSIDFKTGAPGYIGEGEGRLIIPPGTRLEVLSVRDDKLWFRVESDNILLVFNYSELKMQMTVNRYVDLITSTQAVSIAELPAIDIKGIIAGMAFKGMSREGVLAALGYPAPYRTPSLESTTWIYWLDDSTPVSVNFIPNGKVDTVK